MNFSVNQKELSAALAAATKAVGVKGSHPILSHVKIVAEGSSLSLTGYDLSVGITVACPAVVNEPGAFTLPAKVLSDVVAKLSGQEMLFSLSGERMLITVLGGEFSIPGAPIDEYPALPSPTGDGVALDCETLLAGIAGCAQYASTDATKQILQGIHITAAADSIEFAATDGHRLAVVNRPLGDGKEFDLTLPSAALRNLKGFLDNGTVDITWDNANCIFNAEGRTMVCRILDGHYPNYRQLVPADFKNRLSVSRPELLAALERVKVFADAQGDVVTLEPGDKITLRADGRDAGAGYQKVDATMSGDDTDTIAFNAKYLMESLKSLDSEELTVDWNSLVSPVVIRPVGESGDVFHLIMPVRIRK